MEAHDSRLSIEEYVAFLIDGVDLDPVLRTHFTTCEQCRHDAVEAVCAELETHTDMRYHPTI